MSKAKTRSFTALQLEPKEMKLLNILVKKTE